jgi:hypothetical protein
MVELTECVTKTAGQYERSQGKAVEGTAVQDLTDIRAGMESAIAFWSAPALWRFPYRMQMDRQFQSHRPTHLTGGK